MKTTKKPTQETLDTWHDEPKNWKLGILYYNKLDKRIFPPKRMQGMGWTVNFANPWSVLTMVGIVLLVIVLIKFLR